MRKWLLSFIALTLSIGLMTSCAQAFDILKPNTASNVRVEAGNIIKGAALGAGSDVSIRGALENDAFLAGNAVSVDGTVGGNAVLAGRSVNITGTIEGDLFVAAESVIIDHQANIKGDVLAFASSIDQNGSVGGKVQLYANAAHLNGSVTGPVTVKAETLSLGSNARLAGALSGTVGKPFERDAAATVAGPIDVNTDATTSTASPVSSQTTDILSSIYSYLVLLVAGFILLLAAPKLVAALRNLAYQTPGQQFIVGFLSLMIVPAIFVVSLILILTAPIGLAEIALFTITALLGSVIASLWVGDLITRQQWSPFAALALGGAVLRIIGLVPLLGTLFSFAAWTIGFGAVLNGLWALYVKHAK